MTGLYFCPAGGQPVPAGRPGGGGGEPGCASASDTKGETRASATTRAIPRTLVTEILEGDLCRRR